MTDPSTLRRADSAEVADALAYALLYDGNRRVHHADGAMTRITADYLIRHLEQPTCYWPTRLPVSEDSRRPAWIGRSGMRGTRRRSWRFGSRIDPANWGSKHGACPINLPFPGLARMSRAPSARARVYYLHATMPNVDVVGGKRVVCPVCLGESRIRVPVQRKTSDADSDD
jgi:hypothetical protein